jgi:hypothetical protein
MMEIFLEIKGILAGKPLSIFFHDEIEALVIYRNKHHNRIIC